MPDITDAVSLAGLPDDAIVFMGQLLELLSPVVMLVMGILTVAVVWRMVVGFLGPRRSDQDLAADEGARIRAERDAELRRLYD